MNVSPTVKKKWKFFYELKKCFCHLVPQIKQCFGRTSFDVFTKVLASSRTMFRRRWSFLVTKRLLKDEKGLFFSSLWVFSFEKHFLHTCNWFCPQKKKCIHNSMLLWKKDVKMTVKEYKIISSIVKSYFRTLFWPFLEKRRNFEKYILCLVWWNEIGRNTFPIDRH